MLPVDPQEVVEQLLQFQRGVRDMIVDSRGNARHHEVSRSSAADTIYQIDTAVDPLLEVFCEQWAKEVPLILVAEGLEDAMVMQSCRIVFFRTVPVKKMRCSA